MPRKLPRLLSDTAANIQKKSRGRLDKAASFAVATTALQSAGCLRKGTNKLTKRGKSRRVAK